MCRYSMSQGVSESQDTICVRNTDFVHHFSRVFTSFVSSLVENQRLGALLQDAQKRLYHGDVSAGG